MNEVFPSDDQAVQTLKRCIVDIQHLRKVFVIGSEKVVALNDITMQIYEGEVCCLLGTSGSGKSTLLNMMAGLDKPTRGTITICGKRVEKMSERRLATFRQKNMGFVFQSYNLLPYLTALENVTLPMTFKGIGAKKRKRHAIELLKAVGLGNRIKHKPTQMSGGQQQRVGIARAFAGSPRLIFADEPTGNLDSRTTEEVLDMMVSMAKKNNQTLIIVTHEREIAGYADRIFHMRDGDISAEERTDAREEQLSRAAMNEPAAQTSG